MSNTVVDVFSREDHNPGISFTSQCLYSDDDSTRYKNCGKVFVPKASLDEEINQDKAKTQFQCLSFIEKSINLFKIESGTRARETERERLCPVAHSPNDLDSQGWAKLKPSELGTPWIAASSHFRHFFLLLYPGH